MKLDPHNFRVGSPNRIIFYHSLCEGCGVPWEEKNSRSWNSYTHLRTFKKDWDYPYGHLGNQDLVPKWTPGVGGNRVVPCCHQIPVIQPNLIGKCRILTIPFFIFLSLRLISTEFILIDSSGGRVYWQTLLTEYFSLYYRYFLDTDLKSVCIWWFPWCVLYCAEIASIWAPRVAVFFLPIILMPSGGLCLVSKLK